MTLVFGRRGRWAIALATSCLPAITFAQDESPTNTPSAAQMEYVTVTAAPIRDSQQAALEAKRMADNYVDIIAADTIGRFPDQNLADSLGRLPGLAIERDQGQARYINFRGAPFRYTSIAFDGIDVPGAENGRTPRFDSFPSVITSRVEANKAILPSMPGEAVAGFINIHTFSPFVKDGWTLAADVGMGQQELGDGDIEKYALRTSWSNDNVGFVVYTSENSREQVTDNREYDLERDPGTGELVVNELDFRSYKVKREDKAYGGSLEYRAEGPLQRLFLSTLYSEFVDEEQRNQFVFAFDSPQPGVANSGQAVTINRLLEDGRYDNSTETHTLGADFQAGRWLLEARVQAVETSFETFLPIPYSAGATAVAGYDLGDREDPIINLDRSLDSLTYATDLGMVYSQEMLIDALKVKFDAERDIRWLNHDATLKIGLARDSRDASGHVTTSVLGAFPSSVDIDAFNSSARWESNTTNSIGATYYNNAGLRAAWAAAGGLGNVAIAPENLIAINEEIMAGYAMVTTLFSWGNIVSGARFERTEYSSAGTIEGEALKVEDSFDHLLPSVHVNVDLRDDLKLRVSATTGLNRPSYPEWRAAARISVPDREVTGGNPELEAEEAMGLDATMEWYFAPASIASVGAFYRQIDNVIYADAQTIDGGLYLASAAGQEWTYLGSVNGDDGEMSGVEVNFIGHAVDLLGPTLEGFGISANMALLDSEFKGLDGSRHDLPGTSDMIYNVSLFYENIGISARINYQYRDEWVSPIEDPNEVWGEQERVDLSISYALPVQLHGATLSVYFNANNLTDETDVRYAANGTINQSESYGRRYLVGLRLNF